MKSKFELNPVFEFGQPSQCHNCKNTNPTVDKDCEIYGDKPKEYLLNKVDCPSKIQDEYKKETGMLTENDVVESVVNELKKAGYNELKFLQTTEKGIDIEAKRDNVTVYIEAKGATSASKTSKRYGLPFSKNQVRTHISVALYTAAKMLKKFPGKSSIICIALPDNSDHRKIIGEIKIVLDQLHIQVIWVTEKREVKLTECLL